MLSLAGSRKVMPFLLRDGRGFAEYLGPPPRGFIGVSPGRVVGCRAGPPALHVLRSGGPARQLVLGCVWVDGGARGRAELTGDGAFVIVIVIG
jgi:hypothetical protein